MRKREFETLLARYRVTMWRDGCVYATEFVDHVWMPMGTRTNSLVDGFVYSSPSTDEVKRRNFKTFRRKGGE